MICAFCQQEFIPIRPTKATMCSDRCRYRKERQDANERYRKMRLEALQAKAQQKLQKEPTP